MRSVLLVLLLLIPTACRGADAEKVIRGLGGTKVIRSNEPPHTILNDACVPCHRGENVDRVRNFHKISKKSDDRLFP